jgi:hypothetical protein
MNVTIARELLRAIKEHVAIQKEEKRMRKEYPMGSCNAEDAWRDFGRREEASAENLRRLAKYRLPIGA